MKSLGGKTYYISFMDDKTRYTQLYLLTHKSGALGAYLGFKAWAHTQHIVRILVLCSDRGGKYLSREFDAHLIKQGTEQRLTAHDTPQENRIPKRLNRMLLEHVQAMLHAAQLPKGLWAEALMYAVWLKN